MLRAKARLIRWFWALRDLIADIWYLPLDKREREGRRP